MNRRIKKIAAAALAIGLVFSMNLTAFATSKEEAQNRIEQLKQEQSELQARLSELQANKADTEAYIQQLDAEMTTVVTNITETNTKLDEINADLEQTQANLEEAQNTADEQYAALKVRIKQMYEQGDPTLLEIITKSEDISTVLNSTEYI